MCNTPGRLGPRSQKGRHKGVIGTEWMLAYEHSRIFKRQMTDGSWFSYFGIIMIIKTLETFRQGNKVMSL